MNGRSPLEQLYLAQRLDLRLDELRDQERSVAPAYAEVQERQGQINNRLEDAEIELERLEKRIAGLEHDLMVSQGGLSRNRTEMDKAAFDAKAQTQYANVVQQLSERVAEYEGDLAPLKERRAELQAEIGAARGELRELRPGLTQLEGEDDARVAGLRGQGEGARQRRAELLSGLEPRLLHTYEQLRRGKKGVAVAVLRGGACSACNMKLPVNVQQRAARVMVKCPSCGRYLITEEQAAELDAAEL